MLIAVLAYVVCSADSGRHRRWPGRALDRHREALRALARSAEARFAGSADTGHSTGRVAEDGPVDRRLPVQPWAAPPPPPPAPPGQGCQAEQPAPEPEQPAPEIAFDFRAPPPDEQPTAVMPVARGDQDPLATAVLPPVGVPVSAAALAVDPDPTVGFEPYRPGAGDPGRGRFGRRLDASAARWLAAAAAVVVVAGGLGAYFGLSSGSSVHTSNGSTATTARPASTAVPSSASAVTTVPATTAATAAPGAPDISAISPSSAGAGQAVTLTGTDFFSSDGTITVRFGSTEAGVSCPSASTCVVTVPPNPGGSPTVPVTVTTSGGTSPPFSFTYQ